MKKIVLVSAAATMLAMGAMVGIAVGGKPNNAGNKITICHATGSAKNPYVRISPDASGVISGHVGHQDQRDIIPPFDYYADGVLHHYPGLNWDAAHQAIYANGCKLGPTTTTTPTGTTPGTTGTGTGTTPGTGTGTTPAVAVTTVTITTPAKTVVKTVVKKKIVTKVIAARLKARTVRHGKAPQNTG